jgi:pyruvate kinase
MPQPLDALIRRLDALTDDLDRAEAAHVDVIAAVATAHDQGATNLVDYVALRRQDLSSLQEDLRGFGVTALATAEVDVRAKVHAARAVVAALRGDLPSTDLEATRRAITEGDAILDANTLAILGPARPQRLTRVMVTLPSEAADGPDLVNAFVAAGMDIARINCAHDDPAAWERMADYVRAASVLAGRSVLVSMDLPGPKLRTGPIVDGPAIGRARVTKDETGTVVAPAAIWLTSTAAPPPGPSPESTRPTLVLHADPAWLAARHPGDRVKLRDARGRRRSFTVTRVGLDGVLAEGSRNAYVANGTTLSARGDSTTVSGIPPVAQRLSLAPGDSLVLTADLSPVELPLAGQVARIGCTLPEVLAAIRPGDPVLLDDGAIATVVESVGDGEATLRVVRTKPGGQRLGAEKGINLPATVLSMTALTPDDAAQLPFIAKHADLVAVSFIRSADDVQHVLASMAEAGAQDLGLVLKIETRPGFEMLPDVLLAAMRHPRLAVMIARGDLAVEVGFEWLSEIPRQILGLCEAAHVPAIWATQVLESLAKTGQPSRAEVTDAAVAQRAECVMLNKGPHIVEAIVALDDILERMSQLQRKSRALMHRVRAWDEQ